MTLLLSEITPFIGIRLATFAKDSLWSVSGPFLWYSLYRQWEARGTRLQHYRLRYFLATHHWNFVNTVVHSVDNGQTLIFGLEYWKLCGFWCHIPETKVAQCSKQLICSICFENLLHCWTDSDLACCWCQPQSVQYWYWYNRSRNGVIQQYWCWYNNRRNNRGRNGVI